jgi:hypothetical protein
MTLIKKHLFQVERFRKCVSGTVPIFALLIVAAALYGTARESNAANRPGTGSVPGSPASQPRSNQTATMGSWTAPAQFCATDNMCLIGGNAALLLDGNVLLFYYPPNGGTNSNAVVLNPTTGALTDVTLPFARDIFCGALSIMPNGQVLVTGGNLEGGNLSHAGTFFTTIFQPVPSTWFAAEDMNYARWYPSTVELPSGLMLEMSGYDQTARVLQNVMETYNYVNNTWTVLPSTANMPPSTLHKSVYPRLVVLPSGMVFLAAPDTQTYLFNPANNTWSASAINNYGNRFYAPHVLLPGLEKVLVAGGSGYEGPPPGTATNTAEVIDFSQPTPAWSYTNPMAYARMNQNLVLLADGTVLAVGGGGGNGSFHDPVLTPELYNPTTGTWTTLAPQAVPRYYHSTAVLLADGRVLSAGSNDTGSMQGTYEIFSPPYLFQGARPVISSFPSFLRYGMNFTVTTPNASSIVRMALIRPGATTHADNYDQRYVDLTFTIGTGQITATAPASGNYAPPGYYMLVIVNSNGVPSVMPMVLLS